MIKDLLRIYKKISEDSLIGTFNIRIICEIYTQRLLKCTLKFQALVARLGEEREFANLSLITFCNMFRKSNGDIFSKNVKLQNVNSFLIIAFRKVYTSEASTLLASTKNASNGING
jgi:hypothetical protein